MYTTRSVHRTTASRAALYRACLDPADVSVWNVPDGMRSHVHAFEARVGGAFRISLTYDAADAPGKSGANTDTYRGRFLELVPDEKIVQTVEFETADPALQGEMRITFTFIDVEGGTEIRYVHERVPDAIPAADNETGTRMALAKLAALVEARS